jgi:hypothetical protein
MPQTLKLLMTSVDQFDAVRVASVIDVREVARVVYLSRMLGGIERWEFPGFTVTLEATGDRLECVIEETEQVVAVAVARAA